MGGLPYINHTNHTALDHDGHQDEHEEHIDGLVIRHFSTWLQVTCLVLVIGVLIVGALGNSFGLYVSFRKKDAPSSRVTYVVLFVINISAILVCVPMVLAGLIQPSVIRDSFCYIQETLTFFTCCINLIIPAFWALETCDKVVRHTRRWLTRRRANAIVAGTVPLVVFLSTLPIYTIKTDGAIHEHGCHWWTTMVDAYVWYQFIILGTLLGLSTAIQVLAYSVVFCRARRHEVSFGYKRNRIVPAVQDYSQPTVHHTTGAINDTISSSVTGTKRDGTDTTNPGTVSRANSESESVTVASERLYQAPSGNRLSEDKKATPARAAISGDRQKLSKSQSIQRRVAKMSMFIIGIHCLFSFPWVILNAVLYSKSDVINPEIRILTLVIVYLTSAALPIVIIVISREHKKIFITLMKRIFPPCRQSTLQLR